MGCPRHLQWSPVKGESVALSFLTFPGQSSALPSLSLTSVIDFVYCLYRSRFLSLILPHPLSLSHSLYLSLDFTCCSSISLASSPSLPRVLLALSLISSIIYISTSLLSSISNLFATSSSHPRSRFLSRTHFQISFLFRFLSVFPNLRLSIFPLSILVSRLPSPLPELSLFLACVNLLSLPVALSQS